MHVGKHCNSEICPDLYVDGWKIEDVTDIETGLTSEVEDFSGQDRK